MDQNFYEEIDRLLDVIRANLEPIDFVPQFGLHESNIKYVFCWALEKAGITSFRTEVSLSIYPQAPHLRGIKGKVKSVVDLVAEVGYLLIGFEFKMDSLSRVSEDDAIAYMNNLSCTFFTCLESQKPTTFISSEEIGRPKSFWLYEYEAFPKIRHESFGLLNYEPATGLLSILKKPLNVRKAPWRLFDLKFNEEDELKYKAWRSLKKEGYKVISEPKPKHVEFSEVTLISAPPGRKYVYFYTRKAPKIKRIDLIAIKKGSIIGVEVKADLKNLSEVAGQLRRYLSVYDLDLLYLAVPIRLAGKAKTLISSYMSPQETSKIRILGIT